MGLRMVVGIGVLAAVLALLRAVCRNPRAAARLAAWQAERRGG